MKGYEKVGVFKKCWGRGVVMQLLCTVFVYETLRGHCGCQSGLQNCYTSQCRPQNSSKFMVANFCY